jgi:hypothetical protein
MTAPENNFCCATDMAPMSEPGVYGVGIIGIVSYSPTHASCGIRPARHARPVLTQNENEINLQARADASCDADLSESGVYFM